MSARGERAGGPGARGGRSSAGRLVVVGDVLLDRDVEGVVSRLCPDSPAPVLDESGYVDRPGGAGLAALFAAGRGFDVALVTALADDAGGARLSSLLTAAGVEVYALPLPGATPQKVRLRNRGRVLLRHDRGGPTGPPGEPGDAVLELLASASAILVSDYGRGVARQPALRAALAGSAVPVVWDPHPRGPAPVPGIRLATPNEVEARELTGAASAGSRLAMAARAAQELRHRWRSGAVAVTLGADGALLCHTGATPLVVPAPAAAEGDTCGAGDRFTVAAGIALAEGALVSEAVQRAVAEASAYVAQGGVAAYPEHPTRASVAVRSRPDGARPGRGAPPAAPGGGPPAGPAGPRPGSVVCAPAGGPGESGARIGARAAGAVVAGVRAAGGTVVATGGCFDLLHAGHVATLEAARRLGDCLVVCLNSDASVSRLKGPDRPLVPQTDRSRLLAALSCVDAVLIFDEPTPHAALAWLRPDIWVKGGDYGAGGSCGTAGGGCGAGGGGCAAAGNDGDCGTGGGCGAGGTAGAGGADGPDLPEARIMHRWGGHTVVVPYLDGRSTSLMIDAARTGGRRPQP